jgi:hypothetical protein
LEIFKYEYLRGVEDKIHHLELDEAEDDPWISEEWDHAGPAPPASEEFDQLLKLLEQQRFGIQLRYAERKLLTGWHSAETLGQRILKLSDFLTGILLLATVAVGLVSIIAFIVHADPIFRLIAGFIAALASSGVVAMRALTEGLLLSSDAERYKWYLASVRTLYRRFERGDQPRKVFLLREMERLAYQEMRRFMLSAAHARFVM